MILDIIIKVTAIILPAVTLIGICYAVEKIGGNKLAELANKIFNK